MSFLNEWMDATGNMWHHCLTWPSRVREKSTQVNFSSSSPKIRKTRGNKKCALLWMFHPRHQSLTETSDKHVPRGWKIEKWTNQISTLGKKFGLDPFIDMRLNCRLQGLNLSSVPPSSANLLMDRNVLPTIKGSPQCEVPIRPYTVWDRSPI